MRHVNVLLRGKDGATAVYGIAVADDLDVGTRYPVAEAAANARKPEGSPWHVVDAFDHRGLSVFPPASAGAVEQAVA